MNVVSDKVEALVRLEYEADCKDHGPLASLHEGYAVLLEELQETQESLDAAKVRIADAWKSIRADNPQSVWPEISLAYALSACCACEAIQVAAVCKRIMDLKMEETT